MVEPHPEPGNPDAAPAASPPSGRRRLHPALPWVVAVAALLLLAGIAGLGTAYLVANLSAAPSPDAAFLPTPTPPSTPTVPPTPATTDPAPEPTGAPTAEPSPELTPEPSPGATPLEYVVQRGDSIGRIALRFGVTPESIVELNQLRNPNRIFPGQVLLIPEGSATPSP